MNAYEYGVKLALDELGITKEAQQPVSAASGGINSLLNTFGQRGGGRGRGAGAGGGMGQGGRQPRKIPQMGGMGGMVGQAQRGIQARQARQRRYLNM